MADSFIQLSPDSTGKKVDTRTAPDGDHREVLVVGSPTTADVAEADAANGLDVDVTRLPALAAGTNNIGDVDVLTVPAPLSTTGGGTEATAHRVTIANDSTGVLSVDDNGGSLTVDGTVAVTGVATEAKQDTQITHLATIAGDTTDIETAVELLDDTVATLGTSTYTEATTKGLVIGAVRRDADTTLVDTTNEVAPLQVDANGRLKVEAFSGETLPVSGTVAVTGVATEAKQDTQITHLATIAGDTTAIETAVQIMDDWDEADRAKVNPIVGQAGVAAGAGAVGVTVQRVTLASDDPAVTALQILDNAISGSEMQVDVVAALPAGTNNIGDVDVLTMPVTEVVGDVAADAAVPANPLAIGGRASTALPTAVSADGDSVYAWFNRNGLAVVSAIPGAGLNADPYTLLSVGAQYTTTQTSAVLLAGGASERIIVTSIQIQAGGTTAGTLQVYFGTGAFSRGTNSAIFDGEFAPSATLKPGFAQSPPSGYRSPTLGHDVLVTTSAAINPLTITIWYYLLGV